MGNKPYQIFFPKKQNTPEFAPSPPVSLIYLKHEKKMDYRSAKNAILFNQFPPVFQTIHTPTELKPRPFSLHFRASFLPTIPKKSRFLPHLKRLRQTRKSRKISKKLQTRNPRTHRHPLRLLPPHRHPHRPLTNRIPYPPQVFCLSFIVSFDTSDQTHRVAQKQKFLIKFTQPPTPTNANPTLPCPA